MIKSVFVLALFFTLNSLATGVRTDEKSQKSLVTDSPSPGVLTVAICPKNNQSTVACKVYFNGTVDQLCKYHHDKKLYRKIIHETVSTVVGVGLSVAVPMVGLPVIAGGGIFFDVIKNVASVGLSVGMIYNEYQKDCYNDNFINELVKVANSGVQQNTVHKYFKKYNSYISDVFDEVKDVEFNYTIANGVHYVQNSIRSNSQYDVEVPQSFSSTARQTSTEQASPQQWGETQKLPITGDAFTDAVFQHMQSLLKQGT